MFEDDGEELELVFVGILPEVALFPDGIHLGFVLEDFEHLTEFVVEDDGTHLIAPEGVPMQHMGKLMQGQVDVVLIVLMALHKVFPGKDYGLEHPIILSLVVRLGVW